MSSRIAGDEARRAHQGAVDRAQGVGRQVLRLGGSRIAGMQIADTSRLPVDGTTVALQDPSTGALYFLADYSVADGPDVAGP